MFKQVYDVDAEGYIKNIYIQNPKTTEYITVDPPHGLYRARWDGEKWIESMHKERIDEIYNQPAPLSEIELIKLETAQSNAELFEMMLMMMGGA